MAFKMLAASSAQAIRALRLQRGNEVIRRGHTGASLTVQFERHLEGGKDGETRKESLGNGPA